MDGTIDSRPVTGTLQALRDMAHELTLLQSTADALYWDDRIARPPRAGAWRAAQRALHAVHVHERATSPELARAIDDVRQLDSDDLEAAAMQRDLDRRLAIPSALWAEREAAASDARAAWEHARRESDFEHVREPLERMVRVIREQAHAVGFEHEPYEACVREWEPGIDLATIDRCFDELVAGMRPLRERRASTSVDVLLRPLDPAVMHAIEREAVTAVGFDFERGLLVPSERAFCQSLGPHDVRMTSRFHETPGMRGIHSSLHEAGHGIYAQSFARLGVPATLAAAPGLGLDEASSRTIENAIGRGAPFAEWLFSRVRTHAPDVFDADELAAFRAAVGAGERPTRRLGADEATYDLHVVVRSRIERALVNGDMQVRELPDAWDAAYDELLGVRPADDADGCLQDVHWFLGQWGYFPTYTLGNVYGAQLLAHARSTIVDLDDQLATGDTSSLRAWLDEHVYRHGRSWVGCELVERVTGRPVDTADHVRAVDERLMPT